MSYPEGFQDWSLDQRNEFFAQAARGVPTFKPNGTRLSPVWDATQTMDLSTSVSLKRASRLQAKSIDWIWPGWLARGKMHILGGQPGSGKTTLAMRIAATVSTGGEWPDGSKATLGNVIIWSGEDDPEDTLLPRLSASGADLDRVFFVEAVKENNQTRPFDPAKDILALKEAIDAAGGAVLIIVDPIVSAVAADSHKNSETRRSLQPLVELANSVGGALLGIHHFSKGSAGREPIERITGSIAFGAMARVVFVAAKEPDAEDGTAGRRIFARAKSNIGPDDGGFAYALELLPMPGRADIAASVAIWTDRIEGTAKEMLAVAEAEDGGSHDAENSLNEAKDFLVDLLVDGPKPAKECKAAASQAALSFVTVKRAKSKLGVLSIKEGMTGGWSWALPEGDHQNPKSLTPERLSPFANHDPLRDSPAAVQPSLDELSERQAMAADGVPEPYLDAWSRLQCSCPATLSSDDDWRRALDDGGRFLDQWGQTAARLDVSPADLFDVPQDGSAGGLIWGINGEQIIAFGPGFARTHAGRLLKFGAAR